MAQHDYNIANGSGAQVRADINGLAEAVATLNSGPSAPPALFPNMLWHDTATGELKKRNNANTAWEPFSDAVGLVSIAPQTLTPSEQEQARANIGVAIADFSLLSASQRPITSYNYGKHKGFGIADVLPSGRILVVFCEGTKHDISVRRLMQTHSDDSGLTWSTPAVLLENAGYDLRNCAGGVDSEGNFHVVYERVLVDTSGGNDNQTNVITSADEGASWSSPTVVFVTTSDVRFPPHGKLIETGSDIFVLARVTSSGQIRKIRSTNFGATWSMVAILDPATNYTELSGANLSGNRIAVIARNNNTGNNPPGITRSTDGGANWTALAAVTGPGISMGRNPPITWFDSTTNRFHLFYPSRSDDMLSVGGTGFLRPWYWTFIDADALFNGGAWRKPLPLPMYTPNHGGSSGGDGGYGHIVRANGTAFMIFYAGNYNDDGGGTDLYIANLTAMIGL